MSDPKRDVYYNLQKNRIRNLRPFRNMSDEEFEAVWEDLNVDKKSNAEFERKIERKIEEITSDYDLSDLKANDWLTLRALAQAYLQLEDLEFYMNKLRAEGDISKNIITIKNLSDVLSGLRKDISKMQEDLNITRRIRKSGSEASVVDYINSLKEKARKFYEEKMSYIFCPNCNMLLGTVWVLYPKETGNKITLVCNRVVDGKKCGTKVVINISDLVGNKNSNKPEIIPKNLL